MCNLDIMDKFSDFIIKGECVNPMFYRFILFNHDISFLLLSECLFNVCMNIYLFCNFYVAVYKKFFNNGIKEANFLVSTSSVRTNCEQNETRKTEEEKTLEKNNICHLKLF